MNDLKREIYNTGLWFYNSYISTYGIDKFNIKKDLLLLSMLN